MEDNINEKEQKGCLNSRQNMLLNMSANEVKKQYTPNINPDDILVTGDYKGEVFAPWYWSYMENIKNLK